MLSKLTKATAMLAMVGALTGAAPHGAYANGEEFFQPSGDGKIDLVYFGKIKDQDGKPVDAVSITVVVRALNMTVPLQNDTIGHYRTPDIGAMIKEAGETVDPSQLQIMCLKDGYKQISPVKNAVPKKSSGSVQVDCTLAKE